MLGPASRPVNALFARALRVSAESTLGVLGVGSAPYEKKMTVAASAEGRRQRRAGLEMRRRRRVLAVRPNPVNRARALETSLDGSQVPAVIRDACAGGGQQRAQLRLRQQVALDLQDQPRKLGAIGHGHTPTLTVPVAPALYKTAHNDTAAFVCALPRAASWPALKATEVLPGRGGRRREARRAPVPRRSAPAGVSVQGLGACR